MKLDHIKAWNEQNASDNTIFEILTHSIACQNTYEQIFAMYLFGIVPRSVNIIIEIDLN